MTFSNMFSLKTRDFIQSAILAIGTPVLFFIQDAIPGYNLHPMLQVALSAAVAYLLKNFFRGVPPVIEIDPKITAVVNEKTKKMLINSTGTDEADVRKKL